MTPRKMVEFALLIPSYARTGRGVSRQAAGSTADTCGRQPAYGRPIARRGASPAAQGSGASAGQAFAHSPQRNGLAVAVALALRYENEGGLQVDYRFDYSDKRNSQLGVQLLGEYGGIPGNAHFQLDVVTDILRSGINLHEARAFG